ncbi:MAG: glycosyltransferase family 2 protein [Myxococcota bacterium]|nr:glycosyltransferase family 2 protein [Myxococcota bacterium]
MGPRSATVVVSTRDRASSLEIVLEFLAHQRVPADLSWEIVVVDNAPRDEIRALVRDAETRSPAPVRYLAEPRLGLSAARNRGWREARGDVVAFLDDDTRPDVDWLAQMLEPYEDADVAAVCGRLVPILHDSELGDSAEAWRGEYTFDLGDEPRDAPALCGANMSFARSWLERIGGFDPLLGRTGPCLLASEEHDALRALRRLGAPPVRYNPAALVRHETLGLKLEDQLLRKRYYCAGVSGVQIDRKEPLTRRAIELVLRQIKFAVWGLKAAGTRLRGQRLGLQQSARLQEFVGYHREFVGGPARACRDCPHQSYRLRARESARL